MTRRATPRIPIARRPVRSVLLTVSRVVERKGHDDVLRLLARIDGQLPPYRYYVVGDGPHRPVLQRRAHELGLSERVVFTGAYRPSSFGAYFHHADLFIMLSRPARTGFEGFGLGLRGGGLSGTAAVGSAHGGVVEAVQHDVTGWIVDTEQKERAAKDLLALAWDPNRRRRYADAARAWAIRELDPTRISPAICSANSAEHPDDCRLVLSQRQPPRRSLGSPGLCAPASARVRERHVDTFVVRRRARPRKLTGHERAALSRPGPPFRRGSAPGRKSRGQAGPDRPRAPAAPPRPLSVTSGTEPTLVESTGTPAAIASTITLPKLSSREGSTARARRRQRGGERVPVEPPPELGCDPRGPGALPTVAPPAPNFLAR